MIVVGSENSSNSKRLVEVAKDHGADASYLVDNAPFIRGRVARRRHHGRRDQRRLGAGGAGRGGAGPAGRARLRRRGGGRVGARERALRPAARAPQGPARRSEPRACRAQSSVRGVPYTLGSK